MIYPALCWYQGLLEACNKQCAEYLFQTDKHYDMSYDTGDKTIQCGRHVDVFKLWLMWKAKVPQGILFPLKIKKVLEKYWLIYEVMIYIKEPDRRGLSTNK